MKNLNYVFFEEFKHLDKLCGEIYNTKNGVSSYIEDMKAKEIYNCSYIPNWESDLTHLIQYRHIRNQMAHTEGAFDTENCKQKDIDWVRNFYGRVMNQSDPLALLHNKSQIKGKKIGTKRSHTHKRQEVRESQNKGRNKISAVLIIGIIFVFIAFCGALTYFVFSLT